MNFDEIALNFPCHESLLHGVLSLPQQPGRRGVLMIVGGPQYRAGSHRQFTLLARQLAAQGIPVMRFDYRGMGDSEGDAKDFQMIDEDIRAALDCFFQQAPNLQEVVLWGLCDAASAAVFYAHQDLRVSGLVLLNPWVRTEQGAAKAYLKHYYLQRLMEPELWRKIFLGQFKFLSAIHSLVGQIGNVVNKKRNLFPEVGGREQRAGGASLPEEMFQCLERFQGASLFILCGDDLTAQEFADLASANPEWKELMSSSRVTRLDLEGANHTFSQRRWREQVGEWTINWVKARSHTPIS